jgi:hypothetical protein
MIKFDFDRDKLTDREAQIVSAILATHYDALVFLIQGLAPTNPHARERRLLEAYAEKVRKVVSSQFPDLAIRWEWREPEAPAE